MALLLQFRSADLPQCRFAISPLNETTGALRSLSRPGAAAYHLHWQRQARGLLPGLGMEPLLALLGLRGYQPDFLNPAPDSPFTEIGAELDLVRATPPEKVAAELAECLGPAWGADADRWGGGQEADQWGDGPKPGEHPEGAGGRRWNGDPAAARDLLADLLQRAWSALIEPWWPRLRDVLDADIVYRARRLADAGAAAVLSQLDPKVSVTGGAVTFAIPGSRKIDVSGADLVLIPSVFAWPGAAVSFDPPAVIYPARGVHGYWRQARRSNEDLVRLVGRTRAALLTALAEPASTTGLAARTGIPVSSVSEPLGVMRANGLVSTTRTGRYLLHQRTALGLALAGD